MPAPAVKQQGWARKKIDFFVLHELEAKQLTPSPRADPRTLIQRAYLDLTGLRPSYEQTEAFAKDPSDKAYEQIIERLLASPQYGERWGRYWLDVARYGEDNPTSEATNRPYPFAWRYRDWVIDAINRDVPYNAFVTLQLAADLIPKTPRSDLAATGFLGAGPIYHKDGRLSKDVIENLYMDDWDERVDVVSRGVLGLTVACARCHDHKFDPITSRDYYALAGVFASTVAAVRPIADVDPEIEKRFMIAAQRLFYLSYVANLMRSEPGTKPKAARKKVERFTEELDKIEAEIADLRDKYPDLHAYLAKLDKRPAPYENSSRAKACCRGKAAKTTRRQRCRRAVLSLGVRRRLVGGRHRSRSDDARHQARQAARPARAARRQRRQARRTGPARVSVGPGEGRSRFSPRIGPAGTGGKNLHRRRSRSLPASSSIASGAGISASRWSTRPAISAPRAKNPPIRSCSTTWPRASSPTAGRSNGCIARSCSPPPISRPAVRVPTPPRSTPPIACSGG